MPKPKDPRSAENARRPKPPSRVNGSAEHPRPYVVRRSAIHGKGVFAAQPIRKGARIIEYKGRRVDWDWASRAYAPVDGQPTHTFLFELDDGRVIDANQRGNAARWINHSCSPNCQAIEEDGRVYIEAIRAIRPGEELGYDYRIQLEERITAAEKKRWPCHCGSRKCRGTLLAPKRGR
jgi:SET domain-containing protein